MLHVGSSSPNKVFQDGWSWRGLTNEGYTVCNTYALLHNNLLSLNSDLLKILWSVEAPSKVCSFGWRVVLDKIQTQDGLLKRNVIHGADASICCFYHQHLETFVLLFLGVVSHTMYGNCVMNGLTHNNLCIWTVSNIIYIYCKVALDICLGNTTIHLITQVPILCLIHANLLHYEIGIHFKIIIIQYCQFLIYSKFIFIVF